MNKTYLILILLSSISLLAENLVEISISEQRLYLFEENRVIISYPISSSAYGEGQTENSLKTPKNSFVDRVPSLKYFENSDYQLCRAQKLAKKKLNVTYFPTDNQFYFELTI